MSVSVSSSSTTRRARMDGVLSSSTHGTPRSASYTRPKRALSARPPRSNSAHKLKEEPPEDEKEKRKQAEEAFLSWLKRKQLMPRQPRASPSREQIEQHNKEDARQKVLNQWLARKVRRENGTI